MALRPNSSEIKAVKRLPQIWPTDKIEAEKKYVFDFYFFWVRLIIYQKQHRLSYPNCNLGPFLVAAN